MKSSLIIDTQNTAGKALQKTITYINPEATNADLKTFAQKYAAITTDSYVDASRVNKINVDSQDSGGISKPEPTLTVDSDGKITYNGDGQLSINQDSIVDADKLFFNINNNQIRCINSGNPSDFATSYKCIVYASEGANYAAKSVSFSK